MSVSAAMLTLTLALGAFAPQQAGSAPLTPELELRVQALGKLIRCPVCQGLSIADSSSASARAQMDKVRELITAGQTDDQVRAYFVARYGEWALLEPPAHGFNLLVWLGPLALLLVGLVVVFRTGRPRKTGLVPVATPAAGEDKYLDAIRAEVDR